MINILSVILGLITCKDNRNNEDISQMKLEIILIKENHLKHIQDDIKHIEKDIAEMKTDIKIILSKL